MRKSGLLLMLTVNFFFPATGTIAETLVYEDVKPIIDGTCVPCHNDNGAAFFLPFTSLEHIKGNQNVMTEAIEGDYMPQGEPPGFRQTVNGQKLLSWLRTGPDLRDQPPPASEHIIMRDPRTLHYTDVKPIIDRNCVGCHNRQGRASDLSFDTLPGIRRERADMWDELDSGTMPMGDREFRFSADGRALLGWLRFGRD